MAGEVDGPALAAITAGALLAFAGIKGYSIPQAAQDIIRGRAPSGPPVTPITGTAGSTGPGSGTPPGLPSAGGGSPDANRALGRMMAAAYGWTGDDWACLESGWEEESGWSATAANVPSDPYNHAYGIPQSNPGTKMAAAGPDWKTNAATQIKWGLSYIRARYGSPSRVPGWSPSGPLPGYVGY